MEIKKVNEVEQKGIDQEKILKYLDMKLKMVKLSKVESTPSEELLDIKEYVKSGNCDMK